MINTKMIVIGVLFFLVANPRAYKLVNTLLSKVGLKGVIYSGGCVSPTGVVIHAAIFTLLFCLLFSCLGVIEEGFIEGAKVAGDYNLNEDIPDMSPPPYFDGAAADDEMDMGDKKPMPGMDMPDMDML
jgi:hypothetical protein